MIKTKKILILGGLGFLGKNLIEEFICDDKFEIIVFDSYKKDFSKEVIHKNIKLYQGDFCLQEDLEKVFKENKIDIVFHLISTTIPSNSNENIIFDIKSNLESTIVLLDLLKKYSVPKIVFLSSGGTIYGMPESKDLIPFSEDNKNNPICSYGIVKLAIEKYLYLYRYLYNIDYLILRLSNPYGEHHSSSLQGLINVVINNIINKKEVIIWGDGETVRDYIYVKDVTKIIKYFIDKNIINEVINIGSGIGYSINEILKIIEGITGKFKINRKESRKSDVSKIVLDTFKMKSIIDFSLTDIKEGIKITYEWNKQKK